MLGRVSGLRLSLPLAAFLLAATFGAFPAPARAGVASGGAGNVFVAANGSDSGSHCIRYASAVSDPDGGGTTLCASLNKAYAIAQPGDTVEVESGSYPAQTIQKGGQSQAGPVIYFRCAQAHGCVVHGDLSLGSNCCFSTQSASYVSFDGFDVAQGCFDTFYNGTTDPKPTAITFTNGHIWQTTVNSGCHLANISSLDSVTISNTELGPGCCDFDAMTVGIPRDGAPNPSNILLNGLYVHDIYGSCTEMPAGMTALYGCSTTGFDDPSPFCGANCDHVDGLQSFGCLNCTIENSTWYRAGAQQLFLSSYRGTFQNLNIINNLIGSKGTTKEGGCGTICILYQGGAGGTYSSGTFNIVNNTSGSANGGGLNLYNGSFVPGTKINIVGNIFSSAAAGGYNSCTLTLSDGSKYTPAWSYNLISDHTCGSTDVKGAATYQNSAVATENRHLAAGSLGIDAIPSSFCIANPTLCASTDVDGQYRPQGPAYDMGADEYVSPFPAPYPAPSGAGYVLDGYGGIHPYNGAVALPTTAYWAGWNIARGIVMRQSDREGGYVLDGYGGVHPFGTASASMAAPWPGFDIARGIAIDPCDAGGNSGYVLDGFGGVHPFGGAPAVQSPSPYWPGWTIARGIAMGACSGGVRQGFVLDGFGGVHPFRSSGTLPVNLNQTAYWKGWDIARAIAVNPCDAGGNSGYVLDGYGSVHSFGGAPAVTQLQAHWPGWDIARGLTSLVCSSGVVSGDVLDGFGGLHPFSTGIGAVAAPTGTGYWQGWDIARGAAG